MRQKLVSTLSITLQALPTALFLMVWLIIWPAWRFLPFSPTKSAS